MNIVTWNVNSLNVRLAHVLEYLEQQQPDILALQETKMTDDKFPQAEIEAAGYQVVFAGQKAYNGVAMISKTEASDIIFDVPNLDDPQRRLLAATINGIRIIDVYIPNGQEIGSEKFEYKLRWLHAFRDYLQSELAQHDKLIVLGDYNIAPADGDIHDPKRWIEKIMCSTTERNIFDSFIDLGLVDTVRDLHPNEPMFSWWDYRMNAYRRKWGIRIDHLLATPSCKPSAAGVHEDYRAKERPSDHAPVWLHFST